MLEVQNVQQKRRVVETPALVKTIANPLISRLPSSLQVDDPIQSGMVGLIAASRHDDPARGGSFETCAGNRLRGVTICPQEEQISTIYGMPAAMAPIAEQILPLKEIGNRIAINS